MAVQLTFDFEIVGPQFKAKKEPIYTGNHSDLKNIQIDVVSPELFPFYKSERKWTLVVVHPLIVMMIVNLEWVWF